MESRRSRKRATVKWSYSPKERRSPIIIATTTPSPNAARILREKEAQWKEYIESHPNAVHTLIQYVLMSHVQIMKSIMNDWRSPGWPKKQMRMDVADDAADGIQETTAGSLESSPTRRKSLAFALSSLPSFDDFSPNESADLVGDIEDLPLDSVGSSFFSEPDSPPQKRNKKTTENFPKLTIVASMRERIAFPRSLAGQPQIVPAV